MTEATVAERGDDSVAMDPQDALRQLVESDGWRVFVDYVRSQWGNGAVQRLIESTITESQASEHSVRIRAILETKAEIWALLTWPEEEHDRLRGAAKREPEPVDRFAQFRRTP